MEVCPGEPSAQSAVRPPTIYDVARAAGVAPSTVSRVFSRPGRVAHETAVHVRAVAERLGYRARPRRPDQRPGRATGVVAVVVSDLRNAFYRPVIRGIEDLAAEEDITIVILDGAAPGGVRRELLERVAPAVDGIIVGDPHLTDGVARTIARQRPVVLLNRVVPDLTCVARDNGAGAVAAADLLARLGHRSVAFVGGPEASWSSGVRWQALREAGGQHGLRVRRFGPYAATAAGGLQAADELRQARASAVVTFNDLMAAGVVRGLAQAGVDVPGEVSVVGFDDAPFARTIRPALTTVGSANRALGAAAMGRLVEMVGGRPVDPEPVILPTRLVVRASTAPHGLGQRSLGQPSLAGQRSMAGQRSLKRISPAFGTTSVSASAS